MVSTDAIDPSPARRLAVSALSYRYPAARHAAVHGVSFSVDAGEFVLLTGPTGCGKSTVLRLLAGLLHHHGAGDQHGQVWVEGRPPEGLPPAERVRTLGFVSQEPHDQLISGTLGEEVAFGMASAGLPNATIRATVPQVLCDMGLVLPVTHATHALSGGQTQRLVTGAALSAGGGLLLLDEPLSQLDPDGAQALLAQLQQLTRSGIAIIMVEHRLEAVLPFATRLLLMDQGTLCADAPTTDLQPGHPLLKQLRTLGLTLPGMLDLADRIWPLPPAQARFTLPAHAHGPTGELLWRGAGLRHRYDGASIDALRDVSLGIHAGERVALLGGNGAGKSTLLQVLRDALRDEAIPSVSVPQDPDLSLFCARVREELAYGPQEAGLSVQDQAQRVDHTAAAMSIADLLERAPQSLSKGQRLRTAIAAALACHPAILLLDEPTAGQDHDQIERMMGALRQELSHGALVFATHDVDLVLRHATRACILHDGRLIADGPPSEVLSALPEGVPLSIPPLARFCLHAGLPPVTAAQLAAAVQPGTAGARALDAPALPAPPPAPTGLPMPMAEARQSGLDPRTLLGLLAAAGVLAISLERPESLALFAGVCGLPLLRRKGIRTWWRRGLLAVLAIIWSTVLSQGLFYAEQPRVSIGHIGPLHLYREGLTYGLAQSMRFVGLALAGISVTTAVAPDRMLAALTRLRIPYGLALMAATALRFLPTLGREVLTVRQARRSRGRPAWRRDPVSWLRLEVGLLRPVVARSWRRAQNLAESLDTRGFDPMADRTALVPLSLRWVDGAVLGLAALVSGAVALSRLLYVLYTSEILYLSWLRPLYGFVRQWL